MQTNIYIDGFNLFHRALQGTPYRWLDLRSLSERLLGGAYQVNRIRYFTANIRNNPGKNRRQTLYHRALETLPALSIHRGLFREEPEWRPYATPPPPGLPGMVQVLDREEKGSDVNLASHLLVDAFDDDYHAALVISNDSDLRYPVQVVRDKFSKRVIIANPDSGNRTMLPGFKKTIIQEEDLEACQLPAKLQDSNGKWIERPEKWAPK